MKSTLWLFTILLILSYQVCKAQIDQNLVYASYFGGSDEDSGRLNALDVKSDTWVTGFITFSANLPVTTESYQTSYAGGADGFIAIHSLQGVLQYSTYLGGAENDFVRAVKFLSGSNGFLVAGNTGSSDFPVTPSAYLENYQGNQDVFLSRFDEGGEMLWSTYFGGLEGDQVKDMVVDASGSVYIVGETYSTDLATEGVYQSSYVDNDASFLAKFDSSGNLMWCTYFDGEGSESFSAVDISSDGLSLYCAGTTNSDQNMANNGWQMTRGGAADMMVANFNPSDGTLYWSSYFGGEVNDLGQDLIVGTDGGVYVSGETVSETNIASSDPHQSYNAGFSDAFLVRFDSDGTRDWSTYYGGDYSEGATGLTLQGQEVILKGYSNSENNIAYGNPMDPGGSDGGAFLAKFDDTGQVLWGTYFLSDYPFGLSGVKAIPGSSKFFAFGTANSAIDMSDIITPDAEQPFPGGNIDLLFYLFDDNTVSTKEYFVEPLSIYPNPSSGLITINRPENLYDALNLEIIDITGKTVFQKTIESPTLSVDVSKLSAGTYLLKAEAAEKIYSTKLVVE